MRDYSLSSESYPQSNVGSWPLSSFTNWLPTAVVPYLSPKYHIIFNSTLSSLVSFHRACVT